MNNYLQVRTLIEEDYSHDNIARRLNINDSQVCYTTSTKNIEPHNSSGRPPVFNSPKVDEIEAFVY